jgi:hypothetical protein
MTATMTAAALAAFRKQVKYLVCDGVCSRAFADKIDRLLATAEAHQRLQAELVALLADAYDAQGKSLKMQWYSATADAMLRARALLGEP